MKHLTSKRVAAAALVLALAGGGGAAIAASKSSSASGNGFLASVARHLGVSTQKLKDATKAAAIDQVNADLAAGRITKAQADELKARIKSGQVPFGGPGLGFRGGPGFGFGPRGEHRGPPGFGHHLTAVAGYLGLTVSELRQKLESGQSLAAVAKAQDKSVDGLKDTLVADEKKELDQAVKDGMLTRAQADEMLDRLKSRIDEIVNGTLPRLRGHGTFPARPDPALWGSAA